MDIRCTDKKEVFATMGGEMFNELNKEVFGEVLDCVEADTSEIELIDKPDSPILNLILNLL